VVSTAIRIPVIMWQVLVLHTPDSVRPRPIVPLTLALEGLVMDELAVWLRHPHGVTIIVVAGQHGSACSLFTTSDAHI
jgi:hypothetical protein